MIRPNWNDAIRYLVAVRLGQELGTDSDLAQAIAGGIDVAIRLIGAFLS
jgi:hypothetical protein